MIVWLLKALEKNPASVFRKKDLIRKSESQFERLKHLGLLAFCQPDPHHETYPCAHPCANACPMDVVNMEGKLFAICPEDSEVDPIPLAKDDIAGYRLAVDMLIKAIREANNFAGDSYSFSSRMYFIGKHVIKGLSIAFILALFPDAETAEPHLLSLPTRIAANFQRIVVVTPSLSLTQEPIYAKLRTASIFPVTLPPSLGQDNYKISYVAALRKPLLAETSVKEKKAEHVFRPNGDFWRIIFQGKPVPAIRQNKRMLYIVELLKNPHKEISALELCRMVNRTGQLITGKEDYAGEDHHSRSTKTGIKREESLNALDGEYLKECQANLEELRVDLDKAKDSNNDSEEIRIQGDIDFILGQLRSNQGRRGQLRKFADERKRAGDTATRSINRAKNDIKPHSEELFQHLKNTIRTGDTCSYKPDQGIDWQF